MKAETNTQSIFQRETSFGGNKKKSKKKKSKKMRKKMVKLKVKSGKANLKNKQSPKNN